MITIYALIVSICFSDGRCEYVAPEVYEDLTQCVMEAHHLRLQGLESYCEEMIEVSI